MGAAARAVVVYERGVLLPPAEPGVFPMLRIALAEDEADLAAKLELAAVTDVFPVDAWTRDALDIVAALELVAAGVALHQLDAGSLPADILRVGGPTAEDGTPVDAALFGVVNLSFEPGSAVHPVSPGDLVQAATWALSQACLPTAAAGNRGLIPGVESVSAWAQTPWVLGVGATEDEAGTTLWKRSSRGVPGLPDSGPTCVAWGANQYAAGDIGTSFAAPRVVHSALLVCAAIVQLQAAVRRAAGGPGGVRLVGAAVVDSFGAEGRQWWPEADRLPATSLPVLGLHPEATGVFDALAQHGVEVIGNPQQVRKLLLASARPIPGYGEHEVGAGFISADGTIDHLARLPASRWLEVLGLDGAAAALPGNLKDRPLFTDAGLHDLHDAVLATMPILMVDRNTHRIQLR